MKKQRNMQHRNGNYRNDRKPKRVESAHIYDMDYVDLTLDFKPKKLEDFIDVINENSKIAKKFKPILIEYCTRVFDKYPDIELRPFYRNLKDLEVIECTDQELLKVTWDTNSCGCYVRDEDKIYVLKDKEYEKGTWDYQVLYHEFSHCLRDSIYEDEDGNRVSIQFMGLNYYDIPNAEALNSLFAVSLFDYEEKDIAYQFQSNAHQIILECMDNYTLNDYVNHSMTYYAKQLDTYNQDDNYALTILSLMNEQYEDYHDDREDWNFIRKIRNIIFREPDGVQSLPHPAMRCLYSMRLSGMPVEISWMLSLTL